MEKVDITNAESIAKDASTLINHISSLTVDDKKWFQKVFFREIIRSKHYSLISPDDNKAEYIGSSELMDKARYIVDWLSGLQERDPNQHGKLSRITFQQALKHSENWHRELARKAEQSDRYIELDAENTPKVLDLGDGWEVFWLKTDEARDVEGDVMGHCIGSGGYDDLEKSEAVFSVRKNNVPHITLHLDDLSIVQVATKGNGDVPGRYQNLVDEAAAKLGVKLLLNADLEDITPLRDGSREMIDDFTITIQRGVINSLYGNPAIIYANNCKEWYEDGKLHRNGGPAVIDADGTQEWYKDGKRHREDGPAVIYAYGRQEWYKEGILHREDGPAIFWSDDAQFWYKNGKLHREDGPAIIWINETHSGDEFGTTHKLGQDNTDFFKVNKQEWWVGGERHRLDGPAVVWGDGRQEWWIDGKQYSEKEFNAKAHQGPVVQLQ